MKYYLKAFKQITDFEGRARRKEYWMFFLFNTLFAFVAAILDNLLGTTLGGGGFGMLYLFYALAAFLPGLAVAVRRLHDTGKSGWMILVALIPLVGGIWFLILMVTDGDADENQYGPNPKLEAGAQQEGASANGDLIILLIVIWMFFTRVYWSVVPALIENYFTSPMYKVMTVVLGIVWAVIPLGLAFTVKSKSKQLTLIILGSLYLVYSVFELFYRTFFVDAF